MNITKVSKLKFITEHRVKKSGLPPGSLTQPPVVRDEKIKITVLEYDQVSFSETILERAEDIKVSSERKTRWINIDGIHKVALVEQVGKLFNIHPLTLEDIINTDQRPKFEDYDTYDVIMMKMLYYTEVLHSEQLAVVLLKDTVITFQESRGGDAFNHVRDRIKTGKGRIRKCGADYLAYSLIDAVVDSYFNIIEKIGQKVELLDVELKRQPDKETLHKLYDLKSEAVYLIKAVWPLRDMVNNMQREENTLINESTNIYLRDVHDHVVRVIETVDIYRDLITGMMEIYHSSVSTKMNEIMKVLTIISTIFIPVTFIVGVYGMNFDYMPELRSKWGYVGVWIVMIVVMTSLVIYFKRKKWF